MPRRSLPTPLVLVSLWALALAHGASVAAAAPWFEGFEGPDTSWRQISGNVAFRIDRHQRVADEVHGGGGSEHLVLIGQGSAQMHLAHAVGRPQVIPELVPSVWIKSDHPGVQLLVRVVLPRTEDPRTGQPVSTLIGGNTYNQPGRWQQLQIRGIPELLAQRVRALRMQLGPGVDGREAYVDQVLLNVYVVPGATKLWIDDLAIDGYADAGSVASAGTPGRDSGVDRLPTIASPSVAEAPREPARRVELIGGSVLAVDGHPILPRAIRYQGESLARLKELGFNTVWLNQPASESMLREARSLGLLLVCPPPEFSAAELAQQPAAPAPRIGPEHDAVLAWDLGWGLCEADLARTRQRAEQIRDADVDRRRPLICQPESELRAFSNILNDLLMVGQWPLATSLELTDYATWIRERPRLARPGTIVWSTVQTEPSRELYQQWLVGGQNQSPPPLLSAEQIRLMVYTAIAAGSRGLLFESRGSLDAADPETRARAAALELVNLELELIWPWVASGSLVDMVTANQTEPPAPQPEITGAVFRYHRTRLLVPLWTGRGAQYVPGQSAASSLSFVVPNVPESNSAYELTPGGLRPVRQRERVTGGVEVTLGEFSLATLVVFTDREDPRTVTSLSRNTRAIAARAAQLQHQLAARKLQIVEEVDRRMAGQPATVWDAANHLTTARKSLARCDAAIRSGDHETAWREAQRATRPLRLLERTNWEKAVGNLRSPVASPATVCFSTLPWHWSLAQESRSWQIGPNLLPAGDFERLPEILSAGWRHFQHVAANLQTSAEVLPEASHSGQGGLRLIVRSAHPDQPPTLVETPPLWITSPPVEVQQGTLVRISGWVHLPVPITGSVDGLMIFDSMTGRAMASRIGDTTGWEPFMLYRFAPESGPMTVTFAVAGLGEVWLDDVTIQTLGPGPTTASQRLGQTK